MSNLWSDMVYTIVLKEKLWIPCINLHFDQGMVFLLEAVVVHFNQLNEKLDPFLADIPQSEAIPLKSAKWYYPSKLEKTFIRKQFPLVLSWAFTIH